MNPYRKLFLLICVAALHVPAYSARSSFETDPAKLSPRKQELLADAERTLNDWSGENGKLLAASTMIDSFIQSTPNFLPIYIEKARLVIMLGGSGTNDYIKANRDALKIIAAIQKKAPAYAKPYVLAGHAFVNVGDLKSAKKSLEQAERIGTNDPWLYNNWAMLCIRLKQYDKVLGYARKALLLSNDSKAMVTAIALISEYSTYADPPLQATDIAQIVFESVRDPEQRMRVATRLTNAYRGDPTILNRAYELIDRQSKETPRLEAADLAMAEWLLKKGQWGLENGVAKYAPQYSAAAEAILNAIIPTKPAQGRIFRNKFAIALSDGDLNKAHALLKNAEAGDVAKAEVRFSKALLMSAEGDYMSVVKLLENLPASDRSFAGSELLVAAYGKLGRADMLAAHYKRELEREPDDAWTLGNYASFLLFTMDDIDGAIIYGDKALTLMKYPNAQNTTALAYLMKACKLDRSGKASAAQTNVRRAMSIGPSEDFIYQYCGDYCADIRKVLARR